MTETEPDNEITASIEEEETLAAEELNADSSSQVLTALPTYAASRIEITGDGNIVGHGSVAVVAKDGGTVNLSLQIKASEMLIETLQSFGLSDDEIVARLVTLSASERDNPAMPRHYRDRAAEAYVKIGNLTLAEIRVDKELLAILGLFLVGNAAKSVIEALQRPRKEREAPLVSESLSQSKKHPKLTRVRDFEPELVFVPAGDFLMGTSDRDIAMLRRQFEWAKDYDFSREQPQHTVYLPDYYIGKYPVTNAQYRVFVQETGHPALRHWENDRMPSGKDDHPVVYVFWNDAVAYCKWLAAETGKLYRLPTEAEWEKAARGTDGRLYPWGDESPTAQLCNFDNNVKSTTPVGQYSPQGDSPYGCADMAGNVWEYVQDWYQKNYYAHSPRNSPPGPDSGDWKVWRGGAYWRDTRDVRCACRDWYWLIGYDYYDGGLRVCVAAPFS